MLICVQCRQSYILIYIVHVKPQTFHDRSVRSLRGKIAVRLLMIYTLYIYNIMKNVYVQSRGFKVNKPVVGALHVAGISFSLHKYYIIYTEL